MIPRMSYESRWARAVLFVVACCGRLLTAQMPTESTSWSQGPTLLWGGGAGLSEGGVRQEDDVQLTWFLTRQLDTSTFSQRLIRLKFPTERRRKDRLWKWDLHVSLWGENRNNSGNDFWLSASVFFAGQTPATVWSTEWAWRTSGYMTLKMTSRIRRQRRGISTSGWQSSWPGLSPFVWCVFSEWTRLGSSPWWLTHT